MSIARYQWSNAWLPCAAYTVCGFQLLFISVHFPAYLIDQLKTPETGMMARALIGFLWLGTVPLTGGLIAQIFGVRSLSTLTGIAFLFHQIVRPAAEAIV